MSITKYWEFTCDHCQRSDHQSMCTKKTAIKFDKQNGGVYKGGKNFCGKDCCDRYFKKVSHNHTTC